MYKFTVDQDRRIVTFTGHHTEVTELLKNPVLTQLHNKREFINQSSDDTPDLIEFNGGTYQNALIYPDIQPFLKAKSKLTESGLLNRLQSIQSPIPKRRRVLSEHDGDWNFDRQWDISPFNSTARLPVSQPFVAIRADFSINSGYKSYQINEYGALCWAVSQILEERGINTTIDVVKHVSNITSNMPWQVRDTISVKTSREYVSPQALANVFRSNYYRRAILGLTIQAADLVNQKVSYGLGQSNPPNSVADYQNGVLTLSIGALTQPTALIDALTKILK